MTNDNTEANGSLESSEKDGHERDAETNAAVSGAFPDDRSAIGSTSEPDESAAPITSAGNADNGIADDDADNADNSMHGGKNVNGGGRFVGVNSSSRRENPNENPAWMYWLMVFISLIAVFSVIFGSYNMHRREAVESTTLAVYDARSDVWRIDPMLVGVKADGIGEFRQFASGDMRVFTKTGEPANPSGWKTVKPASYRFEDGTIAAIQCDRAKYDADTKVMSCKGQAFVSVIGQDKSLADYMRQRHVPAHADK